MTNPSSLPPTPETQAAKLHGSLESAVTAIITIGEQGLIESIGSRHAARGSGPRIRAILHDQGDGPRNGARPRHSVWLCEALWRPVYSEVRHDKALSQWIIPRHAEHFAAALHDDRILLWLRVVNDEDERAAYRCLLAQSFQLRRGSRHRCNWLARGFITNRYISCLS